MICKYFLLFHSLSFYFIGFLYSAEIFEFDVDLFVFLLLQNLKKKNQDYCQRAMFSSKSCMVSGLTFKSSVHFELIFVYGIRWSSVSYWMVCLGNEQSSFCRFWDCIQVLHFGLSCWPRWLLHFFWGIPAHSRSSELNSPISGHLSSLIPKMLTFILAISCLTTSNLPWFMDLTFQVPVQYCSLQH